MTRVALAVAVTVAVAACGSRTPPPAPAPPANAGPDRAGPRPIPAGTHVACDQLIDTAAFTSALGETAPATVRDLTEGDREAVAACSVISGAQRTVGRLGVLPGDELCRVTVYCATIETEDAFREQCLARGHAEDRSVGDVACVRVVAAGATDVHVYQVRDDDTGCTLVVQGGPSLVDNAAIATCARTARETLTPDRLGAP